MQRRDFLFAAAGTAIGAAATTPLWLGKARAANPVLGDYEQRLKTLGIELPDAPAPVATYTAWRKAGNLLFIAGQGPALIEGSPSFGTLGLDLDIDAGYAAARGAGLNVLAQLRQGCGGSLDRVVQCLQVTGYVNSADDFKDQPKVVNGASDLFVEVFGEAGKAARAAVGVNTLPFNVAVEVESVWEIVG